MSSAIVGIFGHLALALVNKVFVDGVDVLWITVPFWELSILTFGGNETQCFPWNTGDSMRLAGCRDAFAISCWGHGSICVKRKLASRTLKDLPQETLVTPAVKRNILFATNLGSASTIISDWFLLTSST